MKAGNTLRNIIVFIIRIMNDLLMGIVTNFYQYDLIIEPHNKKSDSYYTRIALQYANLESHSNFKVKLCNVITAYECVK